MGLEAALHLFGPSATPAALEDPRKDFRPSSPNHGSYSIAPDQTPL